MEQTGASPTRRRLIGIGVGPGDPELVTLKAVRVLREADAILVPATEASGDGPGRAEEIVLAVCPEAAGRIIRVPFSMADRSGVTSRRRSAWLASAQAAVDAFERDCATVCFATIGDPSVYSTFSYLAAHVRQAVPDVEVELVPGITAMQLAAATTVTPLVEGTESLALVPMTAGADTFAQALQVVDTVVAYKSGRHLGDMAQVVKECGREVDAVVAVNLGLPEQEVISLADPLAAESRSYFSTVLVTPRRTDAGGRL